MNTSLRNLLRPAARFMGIAVKEAPDFARLAELPDPVRTELESLYRDEPQKTNAGTLERTDGTTRITVTQGMWLHDFCIANGLRHTLEIGLAYGYSTLYFIALLARHRDGRHTAIDPFANSGWLGIGLLKIAPALRALGLDPAQAFEFIEERSDRAAVDLQRRGAAFDLVFVDGNHRFDDVLVDFYLVDPLCRVGGYVAFDDMWMRSVRTVASFISTNRADYERVPGTHENVGVFRKVARDARPWDHFARFDVARRTRTEVARELLKPRKPR